jgi:hypothetical protein
MDRSIWQRWKLLISCHRSKDIWKSFNKIATGTEIYSPQNGQLSSWQRHTTSPQSLQFNWIISQSTQRHWSSGLSEIKRGQWHHAAIFLSKRHVWRIVAKTLQLKERVWIRLFNIRRLFLCKISKHYVQKLKLTKTIVIKQRNRESL